MEYLDRLLESLTGATGIAFAGDAGEIIAAEIKTLGIAVEIGADGSVYATLPGSGPKHVLIACHGDEVGLMVSALDDKGFIRFSTVGGCDPRIYPGQEVTILGRERIAGYVGVKPPHLITAAERNIIIPVSDLFIDTGLPPEKVRSLIRIGDAVAFAGSYRKLTPDLRSAKALDNRASVACGIMILKDMVDAPRSLSIHFVATSQEEYTGLGARLFSNRLPLDYALVIDVSHAEYPDLREGEFYPLNSGPTIGRGGTIPNKLFQTLAETARELEIPYQVEPMPSTTGTDSDDIAFNKDGIPTAILGIPLRYMHSPVETVSLKDIERTARLAVGFIKKL
jgi:endoglucanase